MSLLDAILVLAAGVAAGTINTVVGSGTLITFRVLLGVGYSPVVANVPNSIGLVPGSVSGAIGYRRELAGQGARLKRLVPASLIGGLCGAIALLTLPDDLFAAVRAHLEHLGAGDERTARLAERDRSEVRARVEHELARRVAVLLAGHEVAGAPPEVPQRVARRIVSMLTSE